MPRCCFGVAYALLIARNIVMAKPHRRLKKANHGRRPANSKARRLKRGNVKC
jgi:hypothetical protein